ncbi:hypothetical protein PHMEG_0008075 [Phytophthora megakarya]|uniref:SET domain-containing protein n=1 Tax=Phytophthora megakarya TaxID=4795 RepID=A0A225WJL8_9STRA|nr:hypothetical protein PHMEG_0008075 [Phytophthora megakarya]
MVHLALYWRVRCIADTLSEEENTPPSLPRLADHAKTRASMSTGEESDDSTGTEVAPWASPQPQPGPASDRDHHQREIRSVQRPRPPCCLKRLHHRRLAPVQELNFVSVVAREANVMPPPSPSLVASSAQDKFLRHPTHGDSRERVPYWRLGHGQHQIVPMTASFLPTGKITWLASAPSSIRRVWYSRRGLVLNSLMQLYYNINCCPSGGNCGNGVVKSSKVALARNTRTRELAVVVQEAIEVGEVLSEYLDEMEHVGVSPASCPRNEGFHLVMTQYPERPTHPIRVDINAQHLGGLLEVANGRSTTVVMATIEDAREGDEITVYYGSDLWFVCRCELEDCRHRATQDQCDP